MKIRDYIIDGFEVSNLEVNYSPFNQGSDIIVHLEKEVEGGTICLELHTSLMGVLELTEIPETFIFFENGSSVEKIISFDELNNVNK